MFLLKYKDCNPHNKTENFNGKWIKFFARPGMSASRLGFGNFQKL